MKTEAVKKREKFEACYQEQPKKEVRKGNLQVVSMCSLLGVEKKDDRVVETNLCLFKHLADRG